MGAASSVKRLEVPISEKELIEHEKLLHIQQLKREREAQKRLDSLRENGAARIIQKAVKRHIPQKAQKLVHSVLVIQSAWRGHKTRSTLEFSTLKKVTCEVQGLLRSCLTKLKREDIISMIQSQTTISKVYRGNIQRMIYQKELREYRLENESAAISIQKFYKGHLARKLFEQMKVQRKLDESAATIIQKLWRGHVSRIVTTNRRKEINLATSFSQSLITQFQVKNAYNKMCNAQATISHAWRYVKRKENGKKQLGLLKQQLINASRTIRRAWTRYRGFQYTQQIRYMQACLAVKLVEREKESIVCTQSLIRTVAFQTAWNAVKVRLPDHYAAATESLPSIDPNFKNSARRIVEEEEEKTGKVTARALKHALSENKKEKPKPSKKKETKPAKQQQSNVTSLPTLPVKKIKPTKPPTISARMSNQLDELREKLRLERERGGKKVANLQRLVDSAEIYLGEAATRYKARISTTTSTPSPRQQLPPLSSPKKPPSLSSNVPTTTPSTPKTEETILLTPLAKVTTKTKRPDCVPPLNIDAIIDFFVKERHEAELEQQQQQQNQSKLSPLQPSPNKSPQQQINHT